MDTDEFKICTVTNALGSVVGMYSVTIVKQPLLGFRVRGVYTCLLTLSTLVIYSISSHF